MTSVQVIPANTDHVRYIAENMRQADLNEIIAIGKNDPYNSIHSSYKMSRKVLTAMVDGQPALMFGVAPISELTGLGSPWLLGTDDICKVKRRFIRECSIYVKDFLSIYPILINSVHHKNVVSIRWLRWLKFKFDDPIPLGKNNELFYPFHMRLEDV